MTSPAPGLQPQPFNFKPEPSPLVVRAFSLPFRALATVLVGSVAYWMWDLWKKGMLAPANTAQIAINFAASTSSNTAAIQAAKTSSFFGLSTQQGWLIAALLVLIYTLVCILRSRTTLDDTRLHQTWLWDKELRLTELAYVKIIRVPGLDWLIAPRLYARTVLGKFNVFYAADERMLAQWQRLQTELAAFRLM